MIREATYRDLKEISFLHIKSFNGYFLSKLGVRLLSRYYKEFINKDNIFLVYVNKDDMITGLVLGTPLSSVGRNAFIRNNIVLLFFRILYLLLRFDKDTWTRIIRHITTKLFDNQSSSNSLVVNSKSKITLLSICVSENCKGSNIAKSLIDEFEKRLLKLGLHGYILTVYKSNTRALHFYENNGMRVYKESKNEYCYNKDII